MYSVYVKAFSDGIESFILQVEMDASSLNTNDVFVIFTKTQVFIWCGKVIAHNNYHTICWVGLFIANFTGKMYINMCMKKCFVL